MRKNPYLAHPFLAGSARYKSLLFTIPAQIVKQYNLDPSTWFSISYNDAEIRLQYVDIRMKPQPVN